VLLALSLAGCLICIVLIRLGTPTAAPPTIFGAEVCAPTASVNCDYVLSSRWARVGPLPTSMVGLGYFAVLALWFAVVGVPNVAGRRWHLLPILGVSIGVCGSLGFLYVLAFQLPVWCTWCAAAHVVNFLVLIFTILACPRRRQATGQALAESPRPTAPRVGAVVGFAVAVLWIIVATLSAYNARFETSQLRTQYLKAVNNPEYVVWRHRQSPLKDVPIRDDDSSIGPADAPFTLVIFGDFQCSKCRGFRLLADELIKRFPDRLRCVFKHFPQCPECNPYVARGGHLFACAAAEAAEAARLAGTPEQAGRYARKLYDSAGRLDRRPYVALAAAVGIDADRFAACLNDPACRQRVREDVDLGRSLDVEVTPALFLNGRSLSNWLLLKQDARFGGSSTDLDATMKLWDALLSPESASSEESPSPGEPRTSVRAAWPSEQSAAPDE
jgi:protein-disulfide isomerase/uncharacterized membrane protein